MTWILSKEGAKPGEILARPQRVCGDGASKSSVSPGWVWWGQIDKSRCGSVGDRNARSKPTKNPRFGDGKSRNNNCGNGRVPGDLEWFGTKNLARRTEAECSLDSTTLSAVQMAELVRICREFLGRFERDGADILSQIVTGRMLVPLFRAEISGNFASAQTGTFRRQAYVSSFLGRWRNYSAQVTPAGFYDHCTLLYRKRKGFEGRNERQAQGKWTRRIQLLHDASAHTAAKTLPAIRHIGFSQLEHPPYSTELAATDYDLLSAMKKYIRGTRFFDLQGLASALYQWENGTLNECFALLIQKLPERCPQGIKTKGENLEKIDEFYYFVFNLPHIFTGDSARPSYLSQDFGKWNQDGNLQCDAKLGINQKTRNLKFSVANNFVLDIVLFSLSPFPFNNFYVQLVPIITWRVQSHASLLISKLYFRKIVRNTFCEQEKHAFLTFGTFFKFPYFPKNTHVIATIRYRIEFLIGFLLGKVKENGKFRKWIVVYKNC